MWLVRGVESANAHVERVSVVVDSALSERGQEPKQLVVGLKSFCFLTCGRLERSIGRHVSGLQTAGPFEYRR